MGKRKNKDFIASDDEDEEFVKSEPESSGEDEFAEEKAKSRKVSITPEQTIRSF